MLRHVQFAVINNLICLIPPVCLMSNLVAKYMPVCWCYYCCLIELSVPTHLLLPNLLYPTPSPRSLAQKGRSSPKCPPRPAYDACSEYLNPVRAPRFFGLSDADSF